MAIELSTLAEAARRTTATRSTVTIEEARTAGRKTVFLCHSHSHSHSDQTYVRGFVQLLRESGWDAYVDWMDGSMPASSNRTTASNMSGGSARLTTSCC